MLSQGMNWIRQMIYLMIFLTLLLQILPKKSYRGYVKFFAGLIFAAAVLQPVCSLIGNGNWEETVISRITELEESMESDEEMDLSEMEKRQQELLEEYAIEVSESDGTAPGE
ncbi:MAG: stage III sporulation protein AF [Clostridiales bacterium]|nr:stage III sporulation protein AF [Clostridiales bacterium]